MPLCVFALNPDRLHRHGHVAQNLFDDVVGGDALGFGFEVGERRWRMAGSGFGFVTKRQGFIRLRWILFSLGFELFGQILAALDLFLPLFFFRPQHGDVAGDVVTALGGHLMSYRADFFDGDVFLHINPGRPHRVIPLG